MSVIFKPVTLLLQSDGNIFTITLDGKEKRYLTFDANPDNYYIGASWSPDGSRIVYTKTQATETGPRIWTMNAEGSDQKQLTFNPIDGAMPTFSPDAKSILFSSSATGNPELWTMTIDGTDLHQITDTTGSAIAKDGVEIKWSQQGSYSPDGTKFAYSSTESGHAEIWVMNTDGSGQRQLTFPDNSDAPDANNPNWSPEGGKIVYYGGVAQGHGYIFTVNPDGSDVKQLTYMHSDDPAWSPDGQEIFFDLAPSDNPQRESWIMNRDGSNQRPLSSTPLLPTRVPAITKLEAVTVPDDINSTHLTGFGFQDITSPVSATETLNTPVSWLGDLDTTESVDAFLNTDFSLNQMWNDTGDAGGCGDGCF